MSEVVSEERGHILVVEDDPTVAEVVSRYLERRGLHHRIDARRTGCLARADTRPPDLVVLDLMLPGLDGFEVCRRLRARAQVPIIMLTARGAEEDRVVGLELGADDYVAKPFSPRELTARVKAVLRRAQAPVLEPGASDRTMSGCGMIRRIPVHGSPAARMLEGLRTP